MVRMFASNERTDIIDDNIKFTIQVEINALTTIRFIICRNLSSFSLLTP